MPISAEKSYSAQYSERVFLAAALGCCYLCVLRAEISAVAIVPGKPGGFAILDHLQNNACRLCSSISIGARGGTSATIIASAKRKAASCGHVWDLCFRASV